MAQQMCDIEGCLNVSVTRRLCVKHYQRWKVHGDPHFVKQRQITGTLQERFEGRRIIREDGCWGWDGAIHKTTGYAVFAKEGLAHRWSYTFYVGGIPDGMHLDHLCRNRWCVNPAHLEPVTPRENVLRGIGHSAVNSRKTHCVHGHQLDGDNLYVCPRGRRECRACRRFASARWTERSRLG